MIDSLVPGGQMIHYGLLSGEPLGYGRPMRNDIRFDLFVLRNWVQTRPKPEIAAALAQTAKRVADGTLASPIAATYGLAAYRQAFAHHERAHRDGKILLRITD
jgi:NADPH:quinone reductase-like Zn-dependent oxidoreductase